MGHRPFLFFSFSWNRKALNGSFQRFFKSHSCVNEFVLKLAPFSFRPVPTTFQELANATSSTILQFLPVQPFAEGGLDCLLLQFYCFEGCTILFVRILTEVDVAFDSRLLSQDDDVKAEPCASEGNPDPLVFAARSI